MSNWQHLHQPGCPHPHAPLGYYPACKCEPKPCDCGELARMGIDGDPAIYCPRCGKTFRAPDSTSDTAAVKDG